MKKLLMGMGFVFLTAGMPVERVCAQTEWITVPVVLADYYGWAYTEIFRDHADVFGWSTAGVDGLGWAITFATKDYEGRVTGLFFVNLAGIAKTLYPAVTLLGASDHDTVERAWIAFGTHTATLLTLELLGKPALSVQSMGPHGDGAGMQLALKF